MPRSRARAGWLADRRSVGVIGLSFALDDAPVLARRWQLAPVSHLAANMAPFELAMCLAHFGRCVAPQLPAFPWYNSYQRCFSALARRHLYHLWCPPLLQRVVCSRRLTMSTRSPRCSGSSRRPPSVYRTPSFFLVAPAAHERLFGAVTKLCKTDTPPLAPTPCVTVVEERLLP